MDVSRPRSAQAVATPPAQRLMSGAVAGLFGGMLFGLMMGMMGMLPMVASLIRSDSPIVGFVLHMLFSAVIGAGFGLLFGARVTTVQEGALWGAVYGFIWWILGPLLIMPSMMGMGPQLGTAFTTPMIMSLIGHLVYGIATGLAYPRLAQRFS